MIAEYLIYEAVRAMRRKKKPRQITRKEKGRGNGNPERNKS